MSELTTSMYEQYRKYLKKTRAEIFQETKLFFEQKQVHATTCQQALHNLRRWNKEAKARERLIQYIDDNKTVILMNTTM